MSQVAIDKWHETVGMIVANRTAGDSTALTSLGDALLANGRVDAAHVWSVYYLRLCISRIA